VDYFKARYHDPEIGRFFSADALRDLHPAFTPYAYVRNNPLRYTDPTGDNDYEDRLKREEEERRRNEEIRRQEELRKLRQQLSYSNTAARPDATQTQPGPVRTGPQLVAAPEKSVAEGAWDFLMGGAGELLIGLGLTDKNLLTGEDKSVYIEEAEVLGGSPRADSFVEGLDWAMNAAGLWKAAAQNGIKGILGKLHPEKIGAGGLPQAYARATGQYLEKGANPGLAKSEAAEFAVDKLKDALQDRLDRK
jgi:hypothetical protein